MLLTSRNSDCEVSHRWKSTSLGECAFLVREPIDPASAKHSPYIGLEHIGKGTLSLLSSGFGSDVTSTKTKFSRGDILFGKLRPYFRKVVRAPFDGMCSTDIWVIRSRDGVDQDYLYYKLASQDFVDFADAGSQGTRMPRAKWEHASRYCLSLPPISRQQTIARVLRTLDDKIELNRRTNTTLEQMAQALFKSWFVDFDPVRWKEEGRWRPGESLPGLPAEMYNVFPSRLVGSPVGDIPERWDVDRLGKGIAEHLRDSEDPQLSPEGLYHHYSIPAFDQGEVPILECGANIKSTKLRVKRGVVLVSRLNPEVGRVWLVDPDPIEQAICSTEFLVLSPRPPFRQSYIYCLAKSSTFRDRLSSLVTGTSKSHQRAQTRSALRLQEVVPPEPTIRAFDQQTSPLLMSILRNRAEAVVLTNIRNTLLPRLVAETEFEQSDMSKVSSRCWSLETGSKVPQ